MDLENRFVVAKKEVKGVGWFGVSRCKLLHLEWIAQGTTSGHLRWNMMERKRMCVCVCVCERERLDHFAVQQELTEHCKPLK